jgi:hypothetical protein
MNDDTTKTAGLGASPLQQPKLDEVARSIANHLTRLENDKEWNVRRDLGGLRLWRAHAFRAGRYIGVRYVSYQGTANLTRDEAVRYLAALDRGFKGRHYEALREAGSQHPQRWHNERKA